MSPSSIIDERIAALGDWRGEKMAALRRIIHDADPVMREEWQDECAVFIHDELVCSLVTSIDRVSIVFQKGSDLSDPDNLLNSSLDTETARGVDYFEKDKINEAAVHRLILAAIDHQTH